MIECHGWTNEHEMKNKAKTVRVAIDARSIAATFEREDYDGHKILCVHLKTGAMVFVNVQFPEFVRMVGAEIRNYPA